MRSLVFVALFSVVAAAQMQVPPPDNVAAPPADAMKTPSGLAYKITTPGTGGEHPKATDLVLMNFTGWTADGKQIETSLGRGITTVALNSKIKGVVEGVTMMVPGETRLLWIPESLAFTDGKGPKGPVVYEIDLKGSMPNTRVK